MKVIALKEVRDRKPPAGSRARQFATPQLRLLVATKALPRQGGLRSSVRGSWSEMRFDELGLSLPLCATFDIDSGLSRSARGQHRRKRGFLADFKGRLLKAAGAA
jgi:hypothetical protein